MQVLMSIVSRARPWRLLCLQKVWLGWPGLLAAAVLLTGCSPTHDWRIVRDPEGRWSVTLPGKPVEVTRQLSLAMPNGGEQPISLRLHAAKVGETRFTMGVAQPLGSSGQAASAPLLEGIRKGLEVAMLRNLRATVEDGRAESSSTGSRFRATGEIALKANAPAVPAFLEMTTLVQGGVVIEALVAGPMSERNEQAIEQFFDSLRVPAQ
jgi:hypothetical protein